MLAKGSRYLLRFVHSIPLFSGCRHNVLQVAKYLRGPLSFHNNPPSVNRPRHRNRHVQSQVSPDSAGREHMHLHFYVQGRPLGSPSPPSELSYFVSLVEWTRHKYSMLSELTLDESIAWAKDCSGDVRERSKRLFRYLSGKPLPPSPLHSPVPEPIYVPKKDEDHVWSFAGLFSGLRGPKGLHPTSNREPVDQVWTDGEIHADFIRVRSVLPDNVV